MAYYEAPSFSLGLDLDFDSEPQIPVMDCATQKPGSDCSLGPSASSKEDDGGVVGTEAADCIGETENDPPRKLKRLKRGPAGCSSIAKKNELSSLLSVVDDDIEEFSSQEDCPRGISVSADCHPSSLFQSVCSSSKVPPLHGILTSPTSSQLKEKKDKHTVDAPTSVGLEKQNKSLFSNLTISPLRKFQLLESDSDDPSSSDNESIKAPKAASSLNKQNSTFGQSATVHEKKKSLTASITQKEDLWKDFCQTKSFHLPTPAFDEVCKEFSQLKKDNKVATELGSSVHISCMDNHINNSGCSNELMELSCPAHYYFFHDDPRVQKLVRHRLPNFCPLGVDDSRASVIDYMRQFSNGGASTSQPSQVNMEKSSKRPTNISKGSKNIASKCRANEKAVSPSRSKKAPKRAATQKNKIVGSSRNVKSKQGASNCEELFNDSGSWVDPKSSISSLPRDAGKRRVHAGGQSAGHWYTSPEGKKVYVTKSGEELTGRTAYRFYKKDTGGFRKSKKKGASKKRKG